MGKVPLGEARTTSSDERVIIRSKVWPDKWVGPETCCERLNVSSKSINFMVSLSRRSSKWKLKSPEITRTSGHITTFSKNWENSSKKTEAETGCNEEYGGRYTIMCLIERSCTLTIHSEYSKDLFSFPSTNETLTESRNRIPVPPPRFCDCREIFLKKYPATDNWEILTESGSFNQVSVTVRRPMSFSTTWSIMLSILFLTDLELKTAKFRKVERGLANKFVWSKELDEVTLEDQWLFTFTGVTTQRLQIAWLLATKKSFASIGSRVVGLFCTHQWGV